MTLSVRGPVKFWATIPRSRPQIQPDPSGCMWRMQCSRVRGGGEVGIYLGHQQGSGMHEGGVTGLPKISREGGIDCCYLLKVLPPV